MSTTFSPRTASGRPRRSIATRIVAAVTAVLSATACSVSAADPILGASASPTPTTVVAPRQPEPLASNVPMVALRPGERPPQFILFSFDGVGVSPNWDLFLDTAAASNARFTALMTGLYFLTDAARARYRAPGHRPGEAAIGFGGDRAEVREQIAHLNRTWRAGHEMGTHYVGHFCQGTRYPGAVWTAADWKHELNQFFSLMTNWRANTGITEGPDLAFGTDVVTGGRTQCLEGRPATVFPALRAHGMTWDSSMPATQPGIVWPRRVRGIWEFAIPYVYSPALKTRQTALDYNFWVTLNGAADDPKAARRMGRAVEQTYEYMYRRAFNGNRAPLVIANHFNSWSGNAFNPATARFMRKACVRPDTVCATHRDVVAWMELQSPDVLAGLQRLPAVAVDARR